MSNSAEAQPRRPILQPKILTTIREYSWTLFWGDLLAGVTVAMVALPLSLAIAIASGADPVKGLVTAVVGGFFISLLGGSRVQIGGPTGAFIVVVFGVIAEHGYDGLVIATAMAGVLLVIAGYLRIGNLIAFVPDAVVNGFTIGIALIIATSQLQDFFGLSVEDVPADFLEKLPVLWQARDTATRSAILIAVLTMALIVILRKRFPKFPGILLAVAIGSGLAAALSLPVDTIASRFGALPSRFPMPGLPDLSPERVVELLPSAIVIAFLAGVESLLSAMVADRMIDGKHRPNAEIVAQGIANIASSLFGGMPATGAIARTATNVRAGAHGPVAGMMHSLFLLVFVLLLAPLARFIPLASLAGVLLVVAWNMIEKDAIRALVRASWGDALVLLVTVALTLFRDLTEAIIAGVALGALLVLQRMARATAIRSETPYLLDDVADRAHSTALEDQDPDIVIYRISGPLFFGAAASLIALLDRIADTRRVLIVDLKAVPFLDSTAAHLIHSLAQAAHRRGIKLILSGTDHDMRVALFAQGVGRGLASYKPDIDTALTKARRMLTSASER